MAKSAAALILVLISLSIAAFCHAEQMPDSANQELKIILAQPEFTPRDTPLSIIDQLKQHASTVLHALIEKLGQIMPDFNPSIDSDAWWVKALSAIGSFILWLADIITIVGVFILKLLVVIAMGYAVYLAYRYYLKSNLKQAHSFPSQATPREIDLLALLKTGDYRGLLSGSMTILRDNFISRYHLTPGRTDRELLSIVPRSDEKHDTFSEISAIFEQTAYAGREIDTDRLTAALQKSNYQLPRENP